MSFLYRSPSKQNLESKSRFHRLDPSRSKTLRLTSTPTLTSSTSTSTLMSAAVTTTSKNFWHFLSPYFAYLSPLMPPSSSSSSFFLHSIQVLSGLTRHKLDWHVLVKKSVVTGTKSRSCANRAHRANLPADLTVLTVLTVLTELTIRPPS